MPNRPIRVVLLTAVALSISVVMSELARRVLDGYYVSGFALTKNPNSADLTWSSQRSAGPTSTEEELQGIVSDREAEVSWFYDRPDPLSGVSSGWADERRAAFGPEANYVWNRAALGDPGPQAFLQQHQLRLDYVFTFESPTGSHLPMYRLYPGIQTGFGFTNGFGWRSRTIAREKRSDVVRIGALGDSTTGTYPALLEHWLNLWAVRRSLGVRFEVINAARPASGPLDAAAVLDDELAAVDLDYAMLYGFGNGIYLMNDLIDLPKGIVRGRPSSGPAERAGLADRVAARVSRTLEPASRWSAAATYLRTRMTGRRGSAQLPEPTKPASEVRFPSGISERSPDPEAIRTRGGAGTMGLPTYLQALNTIDRIAKVRGIGVFVSTFRVIAFDGMLLPKEDAADGLNYNVLNERWWWPYRYDQIHRLLTFYNRTLQSWAASRGHRIISVNEQMPWRPELYVDAMHERPTGEALHAWIALQHLMPVIREDLAHHRVPRARPNPRTDLDGYWTIERVPVGAAIQKR